MKFPHLSKDAKTFHVTHYNMDITILVGFKVGAGKAALEFHNWEMQLPKHLLNNKIQTIENYLNAIEELSNEAALESTRMSEITKSVRNKIIQIKQEINSGA